MCVASNFDMSAQLPLQEQGKLASLMMTVLTVLCAKPIPVKLENDITEQEDADRLSTQTRGR